MVYELNLVEFFVDNLSSSLNAATNSGELSGNVTASSALKPATISGKGVQFEVEMKVKGK